MSNPQTEMDNDLSANQTGNTGAEENEEFTTEDTKPETEANSAPLAGQTEDDEESFKNKYLRALADYQNLLKNTANEKQEFYKYALGGFLEDLLPIYDNLKMSVSNLNELESQSPWVEGVKYVLKQFQGLLVEKGIEEIKTIGEVFDHNTMEALEGQGEKVIKEVRPGYKLNGRVIVPAKVIVNEG